VSSLSFFLFSFQVHEKSLLFPLVPVLLLVIMTSPSTERLLTLSGWIGVIAAFSMYPLLARDGLQLPYIVLQALTVLLTSSSSSSSSHLRVARTASLLGAAAIHVLVLVMPRSARYPDIGTLLFTTYSFAHIVALFLLVQYEAVFKKDKLH
jgi:alpha-1,3-glucosyltransferase